MITVDPEFASLIPPLSPEEAAQLESNLLEHGGARDSLIVWRGLLVDGHNRHRICTEHDLTYQTEELDRPDRSAVIEWIIRHQFGRRNLAPFARCELALRLEDEIRARAKANQVERKGDQRGATCQTSDNLSPVDTKRELAHLAGVSHDTIAKAKKINEAVSSGRVEPKTVEQLRGGNATINAVYKAVVKEEKRTEREDRQSRRDLPSTVSLFHCSCAELANEIDGGMVDVIITDPPYPKEHLPCFDELAEFAKYALKPGGLLVCMVGQLHLPEYIARLSKHLNYYWTCAYLTPGGQSPSLFTRKVNTFWKPILVFSNGEYAGDHFGDVCKSAANDNDKDHHFWGQSESGMADLIKRFSYPSEIVCDPFLGGGTTAVVADGLARSFIGCDVDAACVSGTKERLERC